MFPLTYGIIISLSSFEVVVLLLDGKVMTFVLYPPPLFRFQKIVKDWNATELVEFQGVIVIIMPNELK